MDQLIGGMLTWIPPAMMSILGILIILRRAMRADTGPATRSAPHSEPGPGPETQQEVTQ